MVTASITTATSLMDTTRSRGARASLRLPRNQFKGRLGPLPQRPVLFQPKPLLPRLVLLYRVDPKVEPPQSMLLWWRRVQLEVE